MKLPERSGEKQGVLYLVLAAFFFSIFSLTSKAVSPEISSLQMILIRSLIMAPILGILAVRRGEPLLGRHRFLLATRGVVGTLSLFAFFYALKRLPLADTVLIFQAHPLIVAALAPWLLGERSRALHWLLLAVSMVGVFLVVGPTGAGGWDGRLAAFICCVLAGFVYILVRLLRRTEHTLTITFWFPAVSVLVSAPAFFCDLPGCEWVAPNGSDWCFLLVMALASLVGQVLLTFGLGRVPAARGTTISNTQVAFALAYGIFFFAELPGWFTLVGALLIVLAQVGLSLAARNGVRNGSAP